MPGLNEMGGFNRMQGRPQPRPPAPAGGGGALNLGGPPQPQPRPMPQIKPAVMPQIMPAPNPAAVSTMAAPQGSGEPVSAIMGGHTGAYTPAMWGGALNLGGGPDQSGNGRGNNGQPTRNGRLQGRVDTLTGKLGQNPSRDPRIQAHIDRLMGRMGGGQAPATGAAPGSVPPTGPEAGGAPPAGGAGALQQYMPAPMTGAPGMPAAGAPQLPAWLTQMASAPGGGGFLQNIFAQLSSKIGGGAPPVPAA